MGSRRSASTLFCNGSSSTRQSGRANLDGRPGPSGRSNRPQCSAQAILGVHNARHHDRARDATCGFGCACASGKTGRDFSATRDERSDLDVRGWLVSEFWKHAHMFCGRLQEAFSARSVPSGFALATAHRSFIPATIIPAITQRHNSAEDRPTFCLRGRVRKNISTRLNSASAKPESAWPSAKTQSSSRPGKPLHGLRQEARNGGIVHTRPAKVLNLFCNSFNAAAFVQQVGARSAFLQRDSNDHRTSPIDSTT